MTHHRQLAAIMFTDIQGYTSLMQEDEQQAIKIRERHREIFNRVTGKHNGKILQYYGDGTLSIFDSAIEAVECGIDLQLEFLKEPIVPVRIGIHSGDIIYSDEEIIGDGVNVASRIESLAVPGSILVSDKVYDEIKNQPAIKTRSLKTFELKNVTKTMEVYSISNKGLVVPNIEDLKGKIKISDSENSSFIEQKKSIKKLLWILVALLVLIGAYIIYQNNYQAIQKINKLEKSIAVLAFSNMSNDASQEYFSDGISEEILNSLVKIEGLKVAGRTSSFSFKGKDTDIRNIGKELGVNLVLEGSVRKAGNKIRITAQLINVNDGYHIWSEQYDRELKDVFKIQEEIAEKIVNMLKLTVLHPYGTKQPTKNMEAYDYYLRGLYSLSLDVDGLNDALSHFQKAIELDPEFSLAYAGLGSTYINFSAYGLMPVKEALMAARKAGKKSLFLDDTQPRGHTVLAYVLLFYDWDWEGAYAEYQKALNLGLPNPNHFAVWYEAMVNNDVDQAIEDSKKILERDPLSFEAYWHLGQSYYIGRRYLEAIEAYEAALEINPDYSEAYRGIGTSYRELKEYDKAFVAIGKAVEITNGQGPAAMDMLTLLGATGQIEELKKGLTEMHELAKQHRIPPVVFALAYAYLGNMDEAFKWLEETYNERFLWLLSIRQEADWDIFKGDPRFNEFVNKMNFPENTSNN